jgi:hypothetical protein
MSGIIDKVKDAVAHHGDKKSHGTEHHTGTTHDSKKSSNYGPHDSNVANAADPRVDSDRSAYNTSSTGHSTGAGVTGAGMTGASHNAYDFGRSTNYGPHDSNVANTAEPRIDSDRSGHSAYNTTSTGPISTGPLASGTGHDAYNSGRSSNYGPHDSNVANTVDPRIDSDRSGHSAYNTTSTGPTSTGPTSTLASGTGHNAYNSGRSSNYGPHNSNMANAFDPRVDSDRSAQHSSTGHPSAGITGAGMAGAGVAGAGMAGAHHTHDSHRSSNYGPHDSNIANTADPRVDSDLSNRHGGTGVSHHPSTHSYATGPASSTAGPHSSNLANKADPRVDSDMSKQKTHSGIGSANAMHMPGGSGNTTTKSFEQAQKTSGASAGSSYNHHSSVGHHNSTAGPHHSSVGNKIDPRVESDLDNSATLGTQRV